MDISVSVLVSEAPCSQTAPAAFSWFSSASLYKGTLVRFGCMEIVNTQLVQPFADFGGYSRFIQSINSSPTTKWCSSFFFLFFSFLQSRE